MITQHTLFAAVFDNYVAEIQLDDKQVQLALWDTAYVRIPFLPLAQTTNCIFLEGKVQFGDIR